MAVTDEVHALTNDPVILAVAYRSIAFIDGRNWKALLDDQGLPKPTFADAVNTYYKTHRREVTLEHADAPALAVMVVRDEIEHDPRRADRIYGKLRTELKQAQAYLSEVFYPYQ